MSGAMMMERSATMFPGMGATPWGATAPTTTTTPSYMMVPRCTMKVEKCKDGCKITCSCDDEMSCGALQNLCKMLMGGPCTCTCTFNGITLCQCNFSCCNCKCEMTKDGCCFTCTSGDKACCAMCQACCECLAACMAAGCCCTVCLSGAPVCCSTC